MTGSTLQSGKARAGWFVGVILAIGLGAGAPGRAETVLVPGQTVTLAEASTAYCDTETTGPFEYARGGETFSQPEVPIVNCEADPAARTLKVFAGGDFILAVSSTPPPIEIVPGQDLIRRGSATGQLFNLIQIESLAAGEVGSETLPVQVSTEVSWDGMLWARSLLPPRHIQITGTLQVRDLTTDLIVASNTFLFEQEQVGLPTFNFFSADIFRGFVKRTGGTGVDVTAPLLRGRQYAVEVEAKCEDAGVLAIVDALLFGFDVVGWAYLGACYFDGSRVAAIGGGDFPLTIDFPGGDGFEVAPFTVTVASDQTTLLAAAQACTNPTVSGFLSPLAALVPVGDAAPLPKKASKQGRTLPLKLQLLCNDQVLTDADVAPPQIVALMGDGVVGLIDLGTIDPDAGAANDNGLLFRYSDNTDQQWIYNFSTDDIPGGTIYTVTVEMHDGLQYDGRFALK